MNKLLKIIQNEVKVVIFNRFFQIFAQLSPIFQYVFVIFDQLSAFFHFLGLFSILFNCFTWFLFNFYHFLIHFFFTFSVNFHMFFNIISWFLINFLRFLTTFVKLLWVSKFCLMFLYNFQHVFTILDQFSAVFLLLCHFLNNSQYISVFFFKYFW